MPDEAQRIKELFDCGIDMLHLRKPGSAVEDCARLLDSLPDKYLRRIVVHDHFQLCLDYDLAGVHLNRRNPSVPPFVAADPDRYTVSASCHSIAEAAEKKADAAYIFLSPIFDSISKQGYRSSYCSEELGKAAGNGILDSRVIALGGITLGHIPMLRRWHFGGAAFLGDVWKRAGHDEFIVNARLLSCAVHENKG